MFWLSAILDLSWASLGGGVLIYLLSAMGSKNEVEIEDRLELEVPVIELLALLTCFNTRKFYIINSKSL